MYVCVGAAHPLQFRPAPHNLVSKVQSDPGPASGAGVGCGGGSDSEEGEEEGDMSGGGGALYVPPRVLAMPYKEDLKQQHFVQPKTKSEHHQLLTVLRDECSEFPADVKVRVQM